MLSEKAYDYVIVGAGAAGCVLAARLSEDPTVRVLLLEAGGSDGGAVLSVPLLTILASSAAKRTWQFVTEPIPALNNRAQVWQQGRLIGGSSSVNGMIYTRGQPDDYDEWVRLGCGGWGFNELLPFFKKIESDSRGAGPWHGGFGPVRVRPSGLNLGICDSFLAAMAASGFKEVEDLNAGVDEGFGRFDCNIDRGVRVSSARAYLRPSAHRGNLEVRRFAQVLRVCIEKGRATGVEVLHEGRRGVFGARGEVILCAGALNTPVLLMASGVGPVNHLSEMGITPIVDSPEVGQNLRNHPSLMQQYHCTQPVTAFSYVSPKAGALALLDYVLRRAGPIAETFSAVGGFMRSDASIRSPDTMVVMIPSLMQRPNERPQRWWNLLPKSHGFGVAVCLGRPHSVGQVRLRSGTPGQLARIFPNYFDDHRDMAALVRSVQKIRAAMQNDRIGKYIDWGRDPNASSCDATGIEQCIRATSGSLSHPSGTCRMGSDGAAVVDPELRVNGVAALRVADNSIIPSAMNTCLHAPALMIGEKASSLIRFGAK